MKDYLQEIIDRLSVFEGMYTYVRIVDPIEKRVQMQQEIKDHTMINEEHCYDFWKASKQCENCVSTRALNTKKSAMKIEVINEKTYLVQAFPISVEGKTLVVEMLKDVSEERASLLGHVQDERLQEHVRRLNAKLITDELTGIYNRRFVDERLPADLYKAKQSGGSVTVVMADIDHFKKVNDSYGHLIGDCVLKGFATLLSTSVRKSMDWVARYGGEEFIIVLNEIDREKAAEIVEKIRMKVEENVFSCDEEQVRITCSFGIHTVDGLTYDYKKVIGPADEGLLRAKKNGRNQFVAV